MRIKALSLLLVMLVLTVLSSIARADGLIVVHRPPPTVVVPGHFTFAPLDVVYHKVECEITDQVAVTRVDQEFYNPNNARLEGDYIFPLPPGAQIDKFSMDIDGKMMVAELLPADKARKIYEDIVRASKDPALLEYAGRAMFRVRIFPIEPNAKKRVHLNYTELLKNDNNLIHYHYTLNTEKFSAKPLKNVSMKLTINSNEPITTVYSPSHEVEIKRSSDKTATVGFEAKDIRPDTDFHLYIGKKASPVGISLLTYRPDPNKDGYFVLLASPTLKASSKPQPKDVVFVTDTSGSMNGPKIEQMKKALKFCVNTLNADDRFEIVRFSTEAEPFFSDLKTASDENRKKAIEFVDGLRAIGGTAINEALQSGLALKAKSDPTRLFMLVFMTDGLPTIGEQNPEKILADVKAKTQGNTRIFSFGVGDDVNTKLIDAVAEWTRGYSQYVLPKEDIEVSMSNFWGKVSDPVLANLKFDAGSVKVAKIYPREMPDLFKGDQLVAFGTYSAPGKTAVTITGMVNGKQETFAQDVSFEDKTDNKNEWIGKLWAVRRIGYLLDEVRTRGENKELKDEVADLARRWGIVTPYTAMLIIEDEARRNVPVAVRSLRELEADGTSRRMNDTTVRDFAKSSSGASAVSGSVNIGGYKGAQSLEGAQVAAEQRAERLRHNGMDAMAKADTPAAATAPLAPGQQGSQSYVRAGEDKAKELNLGTTNANGWVTLSQKDAKNNEQQLGYRVVQNYAQQSRVVNNRSFFLNGNQWTDARVQKAETLKSNVRIAFNSDAYFKLLQDKPESAQYLALGHNVTFEIDGTVYDIFEETETNTTK